MQSSGYVVAAIRLHEQFAAYARPVGKAPTPKDPDITSRFVSLFLLASLLLPFFVLEFVYTGYPGAALVMAAAGGIMLSSLWIYKHLGKLPLARDVFLGSLFCFLVWEAFYFGSIYSPGSVWLVAMPVVSVLLGSARAGLIWLLTVASSLLGVSLAIDQATNDLHLNSGKFDHLYMVSVVCMIVAIFLFVLMVDLARAKTHQRLEEANSAIRELAERDELTGLGNRRAFQTEIVEQLQGLKGEDQVVILLADLDGFKEINDAYGHEVGDELIQKVASGLRDISHGYGAFVARLGGDEFAVLVVGHHARERGHKLADQVLKFVLEPFDLKARSARVGISIGLSEGNARIDRSELLRRADVAMYEAKRLGKNQLCCYEQLLDSRRTKRRALAKELAVAIDEEGIEVHFQPIVDSKSWRVTSVEALARWTRSTGEIVSPDVFIPIAEESGLIIKLGLLVLRKACQDVAPWQGIKLSVNLSPVQFRSPTLVMDVLRIVNQTGLSPERLELEVTEGSLIEHRDVAQPLMEAFHAAGVKIALDDFGTGYSSIGYLRQYQFDRLKIDRSLVRELATDSSAQGIVEATAILARSLSLSLTAEGVESEQQAKLLYSAGYSSLQGYYFGKPQPAHMMARFLTSAVCEQASVA